MKIFKTVKNSFLIFGVLIVFIAFGSGINYLNNYLGNKEQIEYAFTQRKQAIITAKKMDLYNGAQICYAIANNQWNGTPTAYNCEKYRTS